MSMLPLFVTRMFWPWLPNTWVSLHQHWRLRSRTRPYSSRRSSAQSSLIQMAQPTTVATLRRHSTLCCSHGLMNTSMNASVETTLPPSLAFSTFPEPRTSLTDPTPSINLPSTLRLCQRMPLQLYSGEAPREPCCLQSVAVVCLLFYLLSSYD
jgi:hypothetical protein